MSVSDARLNQIAGHLEGTDLYLGHHGGRYRIGTLPDDADPPEVEGWHPHRADHYAITTTGDGFRGTLREAEAFARGVAAGPNHQREASA